MKINVIGGGFVGISTAITLSENNHEVLVVDVDPSRIQVLKSGKLPFFEPGMEVAFKNAMSRNMQIAGWTESQESTPDLIIICVGTPSNIDGSINLDFVNEAIDRSLMVHPACHSIAIKSTVFPGTTRKIQKRLRDSYPDLRISMVPEFLREGSALSDARFPDRIVYGIDFVDEKHKLKNAFFREGAREVFTTSFSAESIKYISNAFLATSISFTNEIFSLINRDLDFDYSAIISGWHSDKRFLVDNQTADIIKYLTPGFGFGGSCFPKDLRAINYFQNRNEFSGSIISAVLAQNEEILNSTAEWILESTDSKEKLIFLGVSFKENSDDLRESPTLKLMQNLVEYRELFWFDENIDKSQNSIPGTRLEDISLARNLTYVRTNHDARFESILSKLSTDKSDSKLFNLRNQNPIEGFINLAPRRMHE